MSAEGVVSVFDSGVASGEPFLLEDPERFWRVERGAVDLFLVRIEEGETAGARCPVARVERGEAMFGVSWRAEHCALLAHPAPGARVVQGSASTAAGEEIDAWVQRLGGAVGMGVTALTEDGLAPFHDRVRALLAARLGDDEQRTADRLRRRAEQDRARAAGARRILTSVFERGAVLETGAMAGDPLVAACKVVGQTLGIEIQSTAANEPIASREPIEAIARANSVRVRRVALSGTWWQEDAGPLVCYWQEGGQAVAAIPKGPGRYEIYDPATGMRKTLRAAVAARLGPFGHSFYRPFPAEKLTAVALLRFGMARLGREAATILIAGLGAGLLGTVVPLANAALFDTIIPSTDRTQLWQMFSILMAAALATWLLSLLRGMALLRMETKVDFALQAALWDRLVSLPVTFHRGYTAGDLAARSLGIAAIRETLTGGALTAVLDGVFSIFSLVLMFTLSPSMALPATGLVAAAFLLTMAAAAGQVRLQRKLAEQSGLISGLLPQLLGGIAKLRVSGVEERAFARWAVRFAAQKRLAARSRTLSMAVTISLTLFQAGTSMVIFLLLIRSTSSGISTGVFLAFQSAFAQVLASAMRLSATLISVLSIVPLYERAQPILQALPEVNQARSDPGRLTGEIEMAHIAFRYKPELPPVLRDVSLRIGAGQLVAIVGGTGSGKSTLCRLLLGFENPESGSIFFGGQDLAGLDLQAVRRQIGVVLQNGSVLGGDLYSNIVGSSALSVDDAWAAAEMAGMAEDIRNMPMGMHTIVPDGGLGLSGGQRQRLQIARAIVRRPRVVIFDEATSALDNQTQAVVMESLHRLDATRIVVAHRLSTIRQADCIFVLNRGVVEESGSFEELMARGGFFAELAARQLA